jgi:hypothetical protein
VPQSRGKASVPGPVRAPSALQFIARHVLSHPQFGAFVACALRPAPRLPRMQSKARDLSGGKASRNIESASPGRCIQSRQQQNETGARP